MLYCVRLGNKGETMNKIKECANDRFCRVRSFVQVAGIILVLAIVAIILWQKGIITF
jgi:hypothetical protein